MEKCSYRRIRSLGRWVISFLLLTVYPAVSFSAPLLNSQEKHGKHIYSKTTSPSGKEIKAFVGVASLEAPGAAMACANCHGYDGKGRPEGGISPSNITWQELSKSYGVRHTSGREHPAYTEETLVRAITKGIDPAGNKLDPAMPIFSMPSEDLAALIAYLKRLGTELDPGISGSTIRIGTILPSEGPRGAIGEAIEKTLAAYFMEINEQGGIYNRQLDLVVGRGKAQLTREQVWTFLQGQNLFALVSTFVPELDQEIPALVEEETIPLIGPFTLFPTTELALNRYLFYLLSGLGEQGQALINFASRNLELENPHFVILHPARPDLAEVIQAAEEQAKAKEWKRIFRREYTLNQFDAARWVQKLREEKVDIILFFGIETETRVLLKEIQKKNWAPVLLLPGVLLGKTINDIPSTLKEKVLIAFPTLPEDQKEKGMKEFVRLVGKHNVPTSHPGAQLSAYAAAQVLLEGLRRAGREVSREKFIATLEKMLEFDTGLTPLITYGPNRHIGALGAYVVTVDPDQQGKRGFISSQKWVSLESGN